MLNLMFLMLDEGHFELMITAGIHGDDAKHPRH